MFRHFKSRENYLEVPCIKSRENVAPNIYIENYFLSYNINTNYNSKIQFYNNTITIIV